MSQLNLSQLNSQANNSPNLLILLKSSKVNPLTSNQNTINDAIVLRTNSINYILSATPMLVYTGKWESANKITEISWNELEGILLAVDPKTNYKKGNYATEIYWQVLNEKIE